MNQNDLYIEYARVIEMCKGTALENKPWLGVRNGTCIFDDHPAFDRPPEYYQFSVAILEDKPVFPGDILYWKVSGVEYVANKYTTASVDNMTWQPPKPKRRIVLEETGEVRCVKKGEYAEALNAAYTSLPAIFMWEHDYSIPFKYKIWRIVEDTGNKP